MRLISQEVLELFYEGGDNCLFERIWERSFNERIIYEFGNREERRISRQSLRRNVGIGSSEQDLVGDSLIHL